MKFRKILSVLLTLIMVIGMLPMTISYATPNEIPALSENQNEPMAAEIIAGESFTLDLAPIFLDADNDEFTYSVKINGEDAVSADVNYNFTPALGGTYELEFFASDFMATSLDSYKVILTPIYNSAYIEGIANLYEFDCGELSGWMYKVNDWFPNYGCSCYQLKAGDRIEWVYTCDLGNDVGGHYSARNGN